MRERVELSRSVKKFADLAATSKNIENFEKFKIFNKSTHLICVHCPFLYKYENIPIALNFICLNLQDTHQLDFNWKNTK